VANSVSSTTVTPTANESHATIKVNGTPVASGQLSGSISLSNTGSVTNSITIDVTAQDGTTTKQYGITVTRAAAGSVNSNDATLSALTLSLGTLSTVFNSTTLSYTATVPTGTSSISVTATVNEPHASIKINSTPATSGSPTVVTGLSSSVPNSITIDVTAQDGITTKQYGITVTVSTPQPSGSSDATLSALSASAGTLRPSFSWDNIFYYLVVDPAANPTITVKATPHTAGATMTITAPSNIFVNSTNTLIPDTNSPAITVRQTRSYISINVSATDGSTSKTYYIQLDTPSTAPAGEPAVSPTPTASSTGVYTGVLGTPVTLTTGSLTTNPSSGYPIQGRAIPDIAILADVNQGIYMYWYDVAGSNPNNSNKFGGTSMGAPAIAGLIARLNQQRLTPLGWVNAMFYGNSQCFNDITVGNNSSGEIAALTGGYAATTGWDACTGLGSPKGDALNSLVSQGTMKVNTAHGWAPVANVFVKSGSTWVKAAAAFNKSGGTWKKFL
jgi:hypothetical protein